MELTWANANPSENEKIRTHHAKIVVECKTGKPYYSIEWFDTAKQEYYLGYSSYCIDNVLGWLKERFEIVEVPKTKADRIRSMSDDELSVFLCEKFDCRSESCPGIELCKPNEGKANGILRWLQQPVE